MTSPDLSFIRPDVPLSEMRSLPHHRLVSMSNALLIRFSSFLNEFAFLSDGLLLKAERSLAKAEIKIALLESKLEHISLDSENVQLDVLRPTHSIVPESQAPQETPLEPPREESPAPSKEVTPPQSKEEATITSTESPKGGLKAKDHPTYVKYFRMLKMGVQAEAVKQKMSSEDVDPKILEEPDRILPVEERSSSSDESMASFTDSD